MNRLYKIARKIDRYVLVRFDFLGEKKIREPTRIIYSPGGFVFLDHGREPEQNVDPSSPS